MNRRLHRHGPERHVLTPAEGQQVARQVGRPHSGSEDEPHRLSIRVIARHTSQRDLGVGEDHGEYVVEIVRDAAREDADGFHFLRLPELRFELTVPLVELTRLEICRALLLDKTHAIVCGREQGREHGEMLELERGRGHDPFVTERSDAERAEHHLAEHERHVDARAMPCSRDEVLVGARVRAHVLDDDRAPPRANLEQERVIADGKPRGLFPDEPFGRTRRGEHTHPFAVTSGFERRDPYRAISRRARDRLVRRGHELVERRRPLQVA